MRSNLPVINVYKKKSIKSKLLVTQLLYGDSFKRIKKRGSWIEIKNNLDGYKGFIKKINFPHNNKKNTHKVYSLFANLYTKPNLKFKTKKKYLLDPKLKLQKKKINSINLITFG